MGRSAGLPRCGASTGQVRQRPRLLACGHRRRLVGCRGQPARARSSRSRRVAQQCPQPGHLVVGHGASASVSVSVSVSQGSGRRPRGACGEVAVAAVQDKPSSSAREKRTSGCTAMAAEPPSTPSPGTAQPPRSRTDRRARSSREGLQHRQVPRESVQQPGRGRGQAVAGVAGAQAAAAAHRDDRGAGRMTRGCGRRVNMSSKRCASSPGQGQLPHPGVQHPGRGRTEGRGHLAVRPHRRDRGQDQARTRRGLDQPHGLRLTREGRP